ncbi:hypothetical protein ES702_04493 [subsurface metagenome]
MSPILYIEARCEECNDEITNQAEAIEIAILRSGSLLCKKCAELRPDRILKWFSIPKMPEPEELDDAEVVAEEPDAIDQSRKERTDRQS